MTISVVGHAQAAVLTAYHNPDGTVTVQNVILDPPEAKRLGRYLVGDGKTEWQRAEMATKIRQSMPIFGGVGDQESVNFWNEVADIIGAGH